MFENIKLAPADPIFGLADLYKQDKHSNKINLSVGVYKDETSNTPILASVKKVELFLQENEQTKSYLPIEGLRDFNTAIEKLLFGEQNTIIADNRVRTVQALGGTGALRIAAHFLAQQTEVRTVWVSDPTWSNHYHVFQSAGLNVNQYHYYDSENHKLNFEALIEDLKTIAKNDAVLFHGCCHNPTGIDPTPEQWQSIVDIAKQKGWLPIFDFAYQGFGQGIHEDAYGLRLFAQTLPELLIASSCSKNFGLYNERVGTLTLVAKSSQIVDSVFSQVKTIIRANYSNPPAHGAKIVAQILNTPELYDEWNDELKSMRQRIYRMRQLFAKTLQEKGANINFSFIGKQNGMFSYSGLTQSQVMALREQYGIYILDSGRINVAGMTLENMSLLCELIVEVLT